MKTYDICITEILDRHVMIKANSEEEAKQIAQNMYNNEEIVLDYTDLTQTEIEVIE